MPKKGKGPTLVSPPSSEIEGIIQLHPTIRQSIAHLPWWNKSTAIGLLMDTGIIPADAPGKLFDYRLPRQSIMNGLKAIIQSDGGKI